MNLQDTTHARTDMTEEEEDAPYASAPEAYGQTGDLPRVDPPRSSTHSKTSSPDEGRSYIVSCETGREGRLSGSESLCAAQWISAVHLL